jgi:hypothetical protein
MVQEKKRPNKRAKAVAKLLKESEALTAAKTTNDSKTEQNFNSTDTSAKTNAPHKMRPDKKRG